MKQLQMSTAVINQMNAQKLRSGTVGIIKGAPKSGLSNALLTIASKVEPKNVLIATYDNLPEKLLKRYGEWRGFDKSNLMAIHCGPQSIGAYEEAVKKHKPAVVLLDIIVPREAIDIARRLVPKVAIVRAEQTPRSER